MKELFLSLVLVSLSSVAMAQTAVVTPEPPYMRPISPERLTRVEVSQMANAALDHCERLGIPATVNIMDVDGSLRITQTSDRAKMVGIETSVKKNVAVLAFEQSSAALQKRQESDLHFSSLFAKDDRFLFYPGALPIYRGDTLVGAISVGGARANDEPCAMAGLSAAKALSHQPKPR